MAEARSDGSGWHVVTTREGAAAMCDGASGEVMHPGVGPLVEAQALYVTPSRLAARLRERAHHDRSDGREVSPLVLFDVGLGAGSNAAAAWRAAHAVEEASARRLEIVSFERDLAPLRLALERPRDFGLDGAIEPAARALLDGGTHEDARVAWRLRSGELLVRLAEETARADVIFWDPFSPKTNPTLWSVGVFALLRARVREGATLHTYSASTTTRLALLLAGFAVGVGPAVGEKAETTVAATDTAALQAIERPPLDARWLARLARSTAPLPDGAPEDAKARVAVLPQFRSSASTIPR